MAQLHAAMSMIETISVAMADLAHVLSTDPHTRHRRKDEQSAAMAAAKKSSVNRERNRRAQQASAAAQMVEDADSDRLQVAALLDIEVGTSMADLKQITASHAALLSFARSRMVRGIDADEYARYAGMCFELIRDVNDFMRRVTQSEFDAIRLHHHDALLHSDQRPTAASQTSATSALSVGDERGGVYGTDERPDDNRLDLFANADLLQALTPYQTPPISAPSSRPASPPLQSSSSSVNDGVDDDIMGD